MKDYSHTTNADWLDVNKLVHDKGVIRFSPKQSIVTFDKGAELLKWCQNRYTNLNGNSIELSDARPTEYCDSRRFYMDFMTEQAPPKEQCSDYFKQYGDSGFNPHSHKQEFSLFEMLYYIAVELDLKAEFEYSNDFIDKVLNSEKDFEVFEAWWFNGGQEIATARFEKEANENIKPIIDKMPKIQYDNTASDNNLETEHNNVFWNEVERLAFKAKLHLI